MILMPRMEGSLAYPGIMPRRPEWSGSHIKERRGWRQSPLAREMNIRSMTEMHSCMGRRVAMRCLSSSCML